MSVLSKHLAIVLRSVVTGERDRVVTAISEENGIITAFAKNSVQSRRFGGALELFSAAEWSIRYRTPQAEMGILEEASIKRGFEGVRRDLDALGLAGAFSEILLKLLQPGSPAPDLFKLHANALAVLEEQGASFALLNMYLQRILSWSGHTPRWQSCRGCEISVATLWEKHRDVSLRCEARVEQAGWFCPDCAASQTSSSLALLTVVECAAKSGLPIRQSVQDWSSDPEDQRKLTDFLRSLLHYHLAGFDRHELKSLDWALSLSQWASSVATAERSSSTEIAVPPATEV